MNKHLVAVYGTLKRGKRNHFYLDTARFIKSAHTGPGFALFITVLPYLVRREDGVGCEIEIFEVDSDTLKDLDRLEGHPTFYSRTFLTKLDDETVEIYLLNSDQFSDTPISEAFETYDP